LYPTGKLLIEIVAKGKNQNKKKNFYINRGWKKQKKINFNF